MITLYIISIVTFITYTVIVALFFKFLPSISDSHYKIKEYTNAPVFTLFCWLTAFPLLIYWIEYSKNDWNFLPFIACGALMFVGASPAFKNYELERKVHSISAVICLVSSYAWSLFFGSMYLGISFLILSIPLYFIISKNKIYWIEIIAFVNIYTQLLLISNIII